jgi:pimeloyl-ACP methyl ester carboxylesterase
MPYVNSNGARIHWDSAGQGTPVLLIMGHSYGSNMWYPLIPDLTKTHRAIWFDNRGTGESDTTNGVTMEQMAADALAVLDAAGVDKAHVFGVSMGGGIAYEFAMAYPERTLSATLGCTMLKEATGARKQSRASWLYYLPRFALRGLLRLLAKPESYGSAAPTEAVKRDMEILLKEKWTVKGVREQNLAINNYTTTQERARERMTMPVLVLHGDEDILVPVEHGRDLHKILPHSELVIFPGAGHNFLVAAGERANKAFIGFIDRVDAQTK